MLIFARCYQRLHGYRCLVMGYWSLNALCDSFYIDANRYHTHREAASVRRWSSNKRSSANLARRSALTNQTRRGSDFYWKNEIEVESSVLHARKKKAMADNRWNATEQALSSLSVPLSILLYRPKPHNHTISITSFPRTQPQL